MLSSMVAYLNKNRLLLTIYRVVILLLFWVLLFDFQRLLFTIHNLEKFIGEGLLNWLGVFVYSLRLDLATAGFLTVLPALFLVIATIWKQRWAQVVFYIFLAFEIVLVSAIHAGEINAYPEWNHKLTGRVFMHLMHPDEVVRTADYGMLFWFSVYFLMELLFAWRLKQWLFKMNDQLSETTTLYKLAMSVVLIPIITFLSLLLARGGWQQIPINIDAAYFSKHYVTNDLSVNSTYFFGKSYLLYNRTSIDEFMPSTTNEESERIINELFTYPFEHEEWILDNKRPNLVVVVLESWSGNAINSVTGVETATPNFDRLTKEGILFTHVYGVASTSEIGNSAIFSGYPGIPEVSISMQPEKHRKIPCLNEDLKEWGYTSAYLFSGDLKYGNIGGYFTDHGFDKVEDENDFPKNLPKGKLNYYDEDLFDLMLKKINKLPQPFMQCAFTGSTHSPYDYPNGHRFTKFGGVEGNFMNSMIYADSCLNDFLEKAKKESWYENTLFVFIADHGHATNAIQNPASSEFNRIPLLLYGKPLKDVYKGQKVDKVGSQVDLVRTLLYQMGGNYQRYEWSKDLLNPYAPSFALHAMTRGYGWVTPKGNFTYLMDGKQVIENSFSKEAYSQEFKNCQALLGTIYKAYKKL